MVAEQSAPAGTLTSGKCQQVVRGVFITTGLGTGGAEMMLFRLLSRMDRGKFSNAVISLQGAGPVGERIKELGIPVHELGWKTSFPRPKAILNLVRTIRTLAPDIVQGWMIHGNTAAEVAHAACRRRIPVLWNIQHSLNEFGFVGRFSSGRRSTTALVRVLRYFSSWPERIIYVSQRSAEQHARFGYNARRTVVIPNGCDCDVFRPRPECRERLRESLGLASEVPLIGLVARVHPVKDHGNFLRAARRLVSHGSPAHFVLVGKGTTDEPITTQIDALELRGRVHQLGERSDIPELTAGLDVATSSSSSEAFPVVIGEAMACGVPCVVTDVGDSAWLVGETGRAVPCGDSDALSNAWREILELSPAERRRLGEAARNRMMQEFSLDLVVSRYEQLYWNIVHGGRSA
jgi:glycosyltransferase involved in cell wall biosynthesis